MEIRVIQTKMKEILKWVLISLGVGGLLLFGYVLFVIVSLAGVFETTYSKKDLIENYNTKSTEILELKDYFKTIVPAKTSVTVEFDGNRTLSIFHVTTNGKYDSNWGIKVNSSQTDNLLKKLGWTHETLSTLKDRLHEADCISIESGEPSTIGYQRSGMGMYFYKIFNQPLTDSLKNKYNDGCTYIYYKDNIVLEYGGGVVGPQCFEEDQQKQN